MRKVKLVISDFHIGSGFSKGEYNAYEDFFYDDEFAEFLEYFSTGEYGGDCEVELIINGDFFDLLKVRIGGKFPTEITEEISKAKLRLCLAGHPVVVNALKLFLRHPNKSITYIAGNHDLEFIFPGVRSLFLDYIAEEPQQREKVHFVVDKGYKIYPEGIGVYHGHDFEPNHMIDYSRPIIISKNNEPILNLPWGSIFVLKVINRVKDERPYVDKVKPFRNYALVSFLIDTFFAFKLLFLAIYYFITIRFNPAKKHKRSLKTFLRSFKERFRIFAGMEDYARRVFKENPELNTVFFGHSHIPRVRVFGPNQLYINTGSWNSMISLDIQSIGRQLRRPFGLIEYKDDIPEASLKDWVGAPKKIREISY